MLILNGLILEAVFYVLCTPEIENNFDESLMTKYQILRISLLQSFIIYIHIIIINYVDNNNTKMYIDE